MIQLSSGKLRKISNNGVSGSIGLARTVALWPTPSANEDAAGTPDGKMQWMLTQAAKSGCKRRSDYFEQKQSYPTPGTTGMSNGTGNCEKANKLHEAGQISEEERRSMRAGNGGQLNPDWVEWLMGWPIGWTKTEPIELDWRNWVVDPADIEEVPRVTIYRKPCASSQSHWQWTGTSGGCDCMAYPVGGVDINLLI